MRDQGSPVGLCLQEYKSLCTAVSTYSTLIVPKLIRTVWPPDTLKSRPNPTLLYIHVRCTHDANLVTADPQVAEIPHITIFVIAEKPMKGGHCDLLFYFQSEFASGSSHARLQVSVCTAVTICATLVVPKCFCALWPLWLLKVGQIPGSCCTPARCTQVQIWWPQVSCLQR